METKTSNKVTVSAFIEAPVERVWQLWNDPEHITGWNTATPEWHTPRAENDLRPGGRFSIRMEARDGSAGFDFEGVYDEVKHHSLISYTMSDGRVVVVTFEEKPGGTFLAETFDAESENSVEMQRDGWQAILTNFKDYVEKNYGFS